MVKSIYQYIYKNQIFICGNGSDVLKTLKELSSRFCTVKELLDYYTNEL